ncbi:hypothetical protein EDB19DRAFT_446368 [Suillus lakei]|nr:hypothetical protein EDB19DRAFT_446368 [Suillus lakei]
MTQDYKRRLEEFDHYVMNNIPIRLIRLKDMTFVGREDVKKHFRDSVPRAHSEDYKPSELVKYAILSHRWLNSGEPTYKEMKERKAGNSGYEKLKEKLKEKKAGYEKLDNFCDKAKKCKVEFAWSDTCCIDRSSSAELDESIRSMFRWYRHSAICIVHLAESNNIKDILRDEWTRRGWTLQELLAPLCIKFFKKDWTPMTHDPNDKRKKRDTELMKTLVRATAIPVDNIYREFTPSSSKVDERMAWAAKRKTTKGEDMAYCLMGIFNVSLQIAYGEGKDRAFCRLIEAIMQAGDPSVLNWKGIAAKHHTSAVIPQSPSNFLGRQKLEFKLASGKLEMTMTSLGLRVPLVILPLRLPPEMAKKSWRAGRAPIAFDCLLCPEMKIHITVDNLGAYDKYRYAFGIINYSLVWNGSRKVLGIQGKSFGFSLRCQREVSGRWRKMRAEGLIQVNFPTNSILYIEDKYLQTVYL